MTPITLFLLLGAFLLAVGLCWRFLDPESVFHLLDHPNHRSLHTEATPRSGGLAIVLAFSAFVVLSALTGALVMPPQWYWPAIGILLLAVTGYVDDHAHVVPAFRLVIHLLAATALVFSGLVPEYFAVPGFSLQWGWLTGLLFTMGYVVWMINLYNFMDGMDGFAGGMAISGFSTLAVFGLIGGNNAFMVLNMLVVATVSGFLVWNFPPAKIFMGDAGSPVLGYLAAVMSLWGAQLGLFPLWIALLVFSPFIVDATWTLMRRLIRGEKIWQAHREHLYQRLVQAGWGHKKTVLWSYVLMALCALSALYLNQSDVPGQWIGIVVWVVVYIGVIWLVSVTGDRGHAEQPKG